MAKLWSTKDLLGRYDRDLLVWHNQLNYCSFKSLTRIYKRAILPRKLSRIRTLLSYISYICVNSNKRPWRNQRKRLKRIN